MKQTQDETKISFKTTNFCSILVFKMKNWFTGVDVGVNCLKLLVHTTFTHPLSMTERGKRGVEGGIDEGK